MAGRALRLLIVSFYFPPAGGGGVQRVLKLCRHLPELGIEVDVLAPDDPKWEASDPGLASRIPPGTTVHRVAYRGPSQERTPAARLADARGLRRAGVRTAILGRGLLLPDPEVAWVPAAARAALRVVRERSIDVVLTTSPPSSVHLVGAAVRRRSGLPWVADLRDSWLANPHRRYERRSVRAKRSLEEVVARRTLRGASALLAVTPFIADEVRVLAPAGTPIEVVPNGVDFEDFEGLVHEPAPRLRLLHAGSFFGQRTPRPFLSALAALLAARPELRGRLEARFLGAFRPSDDEWAGELGLGDALRIDGFRPHAETLAALKGADVLVLLIPRAGGRGRSVLSGKVYEYLAAERPILALVPPDGAAADLLVQTGSGWVADPDDEGEIRAALERVVHEWQAGGLGARALPAAWRERLDRRARAAEVAAVLRSVAGGAQLPSSE